MSDSQPPSKSPQRPSLFSTEGQAGSTTAQPSILGSLEPDRRWRRSGKVAVMLAMLTVAIGGGIFLAKSQGLLSTDRILMSSSDKGTKKLAPLAVPVVTQAAPVTAPSANRTPTEEPNQPAVIVAENTALSKDEKNSAGAPASSSAKSELRSDENAKSSGLSFAEITGSDSKKISQTEKQDSAKKHTADHVVAADAKNAQAKPVAKASSATRPAAATVASTKASQDRDVDLIAALLTRVSPTAEKTEKDTHQKSSSSKTGPGSAASKSDKRQDAAGRDVVVRGPNDSTETLVRRCRALGFFEGELCRLRICSGRWGSDPGCPNGQQLTSNVNF